MSAHSPALPRREALKALAGLGALGLATLPGRAAARPADAAGFAVAVADQPLLVPFKGVDDAGGELECPALTLHGRWPEALRGRFYRNGPALFERGGQRYHHWFDGDGMVQQFTIGEGTVSHRGRLVRTAKLQAEQRAGRFLVSAVGTHVEGGPPVSGPDALNAANTNALEHGGRLLALWEGGSAYALDPADLATQGPVTWRKDLRQVPFSAHPKVDAAGHLWNIGSYGASLVVWHIDPQGRLVDAQVGPSPFPGGMVHDVAVTERHLVVPLPPLRLHIEQPSVGPRRFALEPGEPLRLLVMEKADIARRWVFELPPQLVFHVGNAHSTADGHVHLSFVGAPDASFMDAQAPGLMAAHPRPASANRLHIADLDLARGKATVRSFDGLVEFPRMDPRRIGLPARWLVLGASWQDGAGRGVGLLHGVQLQDVESGRTARFDYGPQAVAEEHIVVPKPGREGERDAWLLGTVYDARRRATVLNLLDAAHVEDGPVAQAVLPYALPLGFHGNFSPS